MAEMAAAPVVIHWPDGSRSGATAGEPWLAAARRADQVIPTACGSGSCGACEIEVNGTVVRACIAAVPAVSGKPLRITLASDPYW
jgi:ferredoxin